MEQKDIIIECAIRCFEKQGLHFTMQDIASELHIAKKTIYALFPGKDILLCAMLEKGYVGIHADKRRILDSDLMTLDKIREVMIAMPAQYQLIDFRQLKLLEEKYPVVYEKLIGYLEAGWEPVIELIEKQPQEATPNPVSKPKHVLEPEPESEETLLIGQSDPDNSEKTANQSQNNDEEPTILVVSKKNQKPEPHIASNNFLPQRAVKVGDYIFDDGSYSDKM